MDALHTIGYTYEYFMPIVMKIRGKKITRLVILLVLYNFIYVSSQNDISFGAPFCIRPFNQRSVKYGNLERQHRHEGKLSFPESLKEERLAIYLRLAPRTIIGSPVDPLDIVSGTTLSFAHTLDHLSNELKIKTIMNVFINADDNIIFQAFVDWTTYLFTNRTSTLLIYRCPTGKIVSAQCMLSTLLAQARTGGNGDTLLTNDTIIYFLEDDYFHRPSATAELVGIFKSHNPCLAAPYDYGDRYYMSEHNYEDGKIVVVAGQYRHWRTELLPIPMRTGPKFYDLRTSKILYEMGAPMLTPLPGLATHMEHIEYYVHQNDKLEYQDSSDYVSLYFNWFAYARDLVRHIKDEVRPNLWSLLDGLELVVG